MSSMDPQSSKRKDAKDRSKKTLTKLGLDLSTLDLNEHEEIIAGEVVHSSDINVAFNGTRSSRHSPVGHNDRFLTITQFVPLRRSPWSLQTLR